MNQVLHVGGTWPERLYEYFSYQEIPSTIFSPVTNYNTKMADKMGIRKETKKKIRIR